MLSNFAAMSGKRWHDVNQSYMCRCLSSERRQPDNRSNDVSHTTSVTVGLFSEVGNLRQMVGNLRQFRKAINL